MEKYCSVMAFCTSSLVFIYPCGFLKQKRSSHHLCWKITSIFNILFKEAYFLKLFPLERGKKVSWVLHTSIRRQELWNPHQASHLETSGKNHKAIVLVAKAKGKVSCFFFFCQFQWQALACRPRDFKMSFQQRITFMFVSLLLTLDLFSQRPSCAVSRSPFLFGRVLNLLLMETKASVGTYLNVLPASCIVEHTLPKCIKKQNPIE